MHVELGINEIFFFRLKDIKTYFKRLGHTNLIVRCLSGEPGSSAPDRGSRRQPWDSGSPGVSPGVDVGDALDADTEGEASRERYGRRKAHLIN